MIGGPFVFVFYILSFLCLFPPTAAFQVQCPPEVQAGKPTECTWIRTPGDRSSFGLLLREITQDHGGTIVTTVRNTNQNQGTFDVTFPEPNQYLLELVGNLDQVPSNQVPQILASSQTIKATSSSSGTGQGSGQGSSGSGGGSEGGSEGGDTSSRGGGDSSGGETSRPPPSTSKSIPPEASPTPPQNNPGTQTNAGSLTTSSSDSSGTPETSSESQQFSGTPGNFFSPSPSPTASRSSSSDGSSDSGGGSGDRDPSSATGTGSGTPSPSPSSSTNSSSFPPPLSPTTTPSSTTHANSSKLPLILGLTLGLFAFAILFLILLFVFIRSRRRRATYIFYQEKMGGRRLLFSNRSPEGGYGGAFASGVGAGIGSAGAVVVGKEEEKSDTSGNRDTKVSTNTEATDGHGHRRSSVAAAGAIAGGYAYSISESEYSDRTSRTGSLDSRIAELWRDARGAIIGLTRTRTQTQSGDTRTGVDVDGLNRNENRSDETGTGTHFSVYVSEPSDSLSSSEPSVFYTAIPKPRVEPETMSVGQSMGSGIGWLKPESPKAMTLKERLSPSSWFVSPFRPLPKVKLPTSAVPSWQSNLFSGGVAPSGTFPEKPPAPVTSALGLSVPVHHSAEATDETYGSYDSYVSLLGFPTTVSRDPGAPPAVRQQPTPESYGWGSSQRSSSGSTGSGSSIVSYPSVSHGIVAQYESRTSHGRSDEY